LSIVDWPNGGEQNYYEGLDALNSGAISGCADADDGPLGVLQRKFASQWCKLESWRTMTPFSSSKKEIQA
jgi:hypothetical protein